MKMSVQDDYILGSNPNNMRYMWLDSDQTTPAATPTVPAAQFQQQQQHQLGNKKTTRKC